MKSKIPSKISIQIFNLINQVNPKLAMFYLNHERFFNDGIVELACLILANIFIWYFSFSGLKEFMLVLAVTAIGTPITFSIKYLLHKLWVWNHEEK